MAGNLAGSLRAVRRKALPCHANVNRLAGDAGRERVNAGEHPALEVQKLFSRVGEVLPVGTRHRAARLAEDFRASGHGLLGDEI